MEEKMYFKGERWSVRVEKCFERAGIKNFGELVVRSENDLMSLRNFSHCSLKQVKDRLAEYGLSLGMKMPEKK